MSEYKVCSGGKLSMSPWGQKVFCTYQVLDEDPGQPRATLSPYGLGGVYVTLTIHKGSDVIASQCFGLGS